MSEDTDTNLMDTAPGGEAHLQFTSMKSADTTFRYESVNTYHKPHAKEEEQFNDSTGTDASKQAQKRSEQREHKAENIRYGEAVSGHGFGGETTGNNGDVQQQGCGRTKKYKGPEEATETREDKGTVEGSGIGA